MNSIRVTGPGEPTLEAFLDHLRGSNPFLENRVNGPAPAASDVETIHHDAFERLTSLARQSLKANCGLGAVLWGVAGVGKSHLLARLARWAAEENAHCVYAHNLQSTPQSLPRTLLRRVVSALTAGRRTGFHGTSLFHLVRAGAVEAAGSAGRYGWRQLEHLHQLWLDSLGLPLDARQIHEVLFRFFRSAYQFAIGREDGAAASAAVRWLSGEAVDPDEGVLLGLPARRRDEPAALEDAEQIKQVLAALARLAGSQGRPLILALDQMDNLDDAQFAAATRFLEAVLDTSPNLLVVTSGIQATFRRWQETHVVQASAWDRIAQFRVRLEPLTPAQADLLLRRRLAAWLAPFLPHPDVAALRARDGLFPLGERWAAEHVLPRSEIRPRDAVRLAGEAWQRQQDRLRRTGGAEWLQTWPGRGELPPEETATTPEQRLALIGRAVDEEMARMKGRWQGDPTAVPSGAADLVQTLHDLLLACQGEEEFGITKVDRHDPAGVGTAPYDLLVRQRAGGAETTAGIAAVVNATKTSVAASLRRLADDLQPPDRVIVLTDARVGLPLGEKGQVYLSQLRGRGGGRFEVVELAYPDLVEWQALVGVAARAKSQDVEYAPPGGEARKVSHGEAVAALLRQRRYQASPPLMRILVPGRPGPA